MILGTLLRRLLNSASGNPIASALPRDRSEARNASETDMREAISRASVEPLDASGYALRASIAKRQRRFKAAIADYERAVALEPRSVELILALGGLLHRVGRFEDALATMDAALEDAPDHAVLHMNRGLMLRELTLFDEAQGALEQACRLDPALRIARCHLASVVYDQGRAAEAQRIVQQVLAEDGQNIEAHWVAAMMALGHGDFETGWSHYAYRLIRHDAFVSSRALPAWAPGRHHDGNVIVLAEQGLGDEIMFASCFAELTSQVPSLTIECDPRLGTLFARSFPNARIEATRNPELDSVPAPAGAGSQIPAGSLPSFFRRREEQFPRHRGYLRSAPDRVSYWREKLRELGPGVKVGISWAGGSLKTRRSLRSVSLQQLKDVLTTAHTRFVSLQYGPASSDLNSVDASSLPPIAHFPEAIADYDETASLVCALDLVISVTTSIVHLTGALGRPVWVLVPAVPEWRYQRSGLSMPWYPSARLYRQETLWNWQPAVEAIAKDLRTEVSRRSGGVSSHDGRVD